MLAVGVVTGLPAAASAKPVGKLLAYRVLSARDGGHVRAHNGVALYVPAGALTRDALVTITRFRKGVYDLNIAAPWQGRVAVTLPKRRHASVVLHRIGVTWVKEGSRGQRTVWVAQLSPFSWATDKLKAAACFSKNWKEIAGCLLSKGVSKIDSSLVKWIAEQAGVSNECSAALIASKGFVVSLYTALVSSTCRGHAGLGDAENGKGTFPDTHSPGSPSPGNTPPVTNPNPQPQPQPQPLPQPQPPPAPAPGTYAETTGGAANTWTNWTNAGGQQGPTIPGFATVQIACKLPGFRVADGNAWWYRIAQAPWNNQFYVSADAFYNNGQTSGSLHGTPFVDPNVRDC